MEEKERYEVMSPSLNGYAYIHDFKTDNVLNTYDSCDLLNQQDKENKQLKQQLHDLPKKIVEDIEKNFTEYLPLKDKTGAGFYCRLNAILKKFGGGNE